MFVVVAAYIVAVVYTGSLVILLLTTYGAVVQFAPAVYASLYLESGRAVLIGLVIGSLVTAVLVAVPEWRPIEIHAGIFGLLVNSLLVFGLSRNNTASELDERFVAAARGLASGPAQNQPT